jgi:LysM repeat protein
LFIGVIVSAAILSMANLVFASINTGGKENTSSSIEVVVEPGDTLWRIADQYNEQAGMSVNELLFYIQKENQLQSAIIQPGDHIIIPIK